MNNVEQFKDIVDRMALIYEMKNNDYGDSTTDTYNRYGDISFLTRLRDKLNRLDSLLVDNNTQQVQDEKVEDTILDLANYAVIFLMTYQNNKNNLF